jgi:hypothetical protein
MVCTTDCAMPPLPHPKRRGNTRSLARRWRLTAYGTYALDAPSKAAAVSAIEQCCFSATPHFANFKANRDIVARRQDNAAQQLPSTVIAQLATQSRLSRTAAIRQRKPSLRRSLEYTVSFAISLLATIALLLGDLWLTILRW